MGWVGTGWTASSFMRLGQILLEANFITAKQLSFALEYGTTKRIFLGRAITLLQYLQEEDITRALQIQKLMKNGLPPTIAIEVLRDAVKDSTSIDNALQGRYLSKLLTGELEKPRFNFDELQAGSEKSKAPAAPKRENERDKEKQPQSPKQTQPPVENSSQARASQKNTQSKLEKPPQVAEPKKEETPAALVRHGDNLLLQDSCTEAAAQFVRALTMMEATLGTEHIDLAPVLVRLGNTRMAMKAFDEARDCYERVLFMRTKFLPDNHPEIAQTFESLADLYKAQEDDARAMWAYLSALDVLEKSLPGQLVAYALILRKLTKSLQRPPAGMSIPVGQILVEAALLTERDLQNALRMSKRSSLPLGIVLRENGMVGDLELQSALKAQFCIRQGVLPLQLATALLFRACRRRITLDRVLDEAGILVSTEDKLDLYRQIAADLDQLVAAESSNVSGQQHLAPIACRLGSLYEQVGDKPRAEVYYSRALSCWDHTDLGDLNIARISTALAKLIVGQHREEEIASLLRTALQQRRTLLGDQNEETIETIEDLAEAELHLASDPREINNALTFAQQAIAQRQELGQDGIKLLRPVVLMGDCMLKLKNFEGAQSVYKRAMGLAKPKNGQPTPALASVMEKLGDLYAQQQLLKVATPLYTSALLILEASGKRDSAPFEALQVKISTLEQASKNDPADDDDA